MRAAPSADDPLAINLANGHTAESLAQQAFNTKTEQNRDPEIELIAANANKRKQEINYEKANLKEEIELEHQRNELLKERAKNSLTTLDNANTEIKISEANKQARQAKTDAMQAEAKAQTEAFVAKSKAKREHADKVSRNRINKIIQWLKASFLLLLLLILLIASALGLYYLYRLVTEEPIIETITETVTETVTKNVIPEECTQVRRNGKIYVSCDGVTVQGAPTIAESGVDEIPELIVK